MTPEPKVNCRMCTKCGQIIEANGVPLTHYGCSLMHDDLGRSVASKPNDEWCYPIEELHGDKYVIASHIPFIIQEQHRRDWGEFKELLKHYDIYVYRPDLEQIIDSKLSSFKLDVC